MANTLGNLLSSGVLKPDLNMYVGSDSYHPSEYRQAIGKPEPSGKTSCDGCYRAKTNGHDSICLRCTDEYLYWRE